MNAHLVCKLVHSSWKTISKEKIVGIDVEESLDKLMCFVDCHRVGTVVKKKYLAIKIV